MLATLLASAALLAAPFPETIPVPPGSDPEGIATGKGTTFYVGSRQDGSVYSGSLRTGEGAILVPGRAGERGAYGLKARGGKLYVAGGPFGAAYVYDARTGADIDVEQLIPRDTGFINDVTVTRTAAYFTDSRSDELWVYERSSGTASPLTLSGDYQHVEGQFNANGIAATPNGKRLIIVQSNTGFLFTVDPKTGAATQIEAPSMTMGDGILLRGKTLYVVRNRLELVEVLRLRDHFTRATRKRTLTDEDFEIPTTIARHGSRLYVINADFGHESDPAWPYDIVKVG
jgi:DNA-binding beta-propeller fold protein YncE